MSDVTTPTRKRIAAALRSPAVVSAFWIPLGLAVVLALAAVWSGVARDAARSLSRWNEHDWWFVATGALAAMACAAPGCFLVVRKLSMMGDAISHSALPGIVLGFLAAQSLYTQGWISETGYETSRHAILLLGAAVLGVLCAVGTELVQRYGKVESSAALGVIFTSLFALGLLLLRLKADDVDLDPDCVLFGTLENVILNTVGPWGIPRAAITNAVVLIANLTIIGLLFKELRISAFDPSLSSAMGFPAYLMHYLLIAITSTTLVAAFESVGSILVIAMLIVPAAAAYLLTDRLGWMILISLVIAAMSALLGHALAVVVPAVIFGRLGYPSVVDASSAGMMAAAAGLIFLAAMLFGPRYGLITKAWDLISLGIKMAAEDILGQLYREGERGSSQVTRTSRELRGALRGVGLLRGRLAMFQLWRAGQLERAKDGWRLSAAGREAAQGLVRAHRLWESYLAKHFSVDDVHLHESASRAEHFIDDWIREQIASELDAPHVDPHGTTIPGGEGG